MTKMTLGRSWEAFNRRDLDYFERYLSDDVVYDLAGRPPLGGHFVGKAAWREANERWMDSLASFEVRVLHEGLTNPYALGFTNTILTEYEVVETTHDGRMLRTRAIDVSEMKRGKLVAERNYLFDLDGDAALRMPAMASNHATPDGSVDTG